MAVRLTVSGSKATPARPAAARIRPQFGSPPAIAVRTSDEVATVRATFSWDDVGSWEALARTRECDAAGNVIVGSGRAVESERNIIFAEGGEVVLFGTQDLVVVRTGEKTIVLPRSRASELKTLLARLEGNDR